MRLDKPHVARSLSDPDLRKYLVSQKIFFASSETSRAAGAAFVERLQQRKQNREPPSGPEVAQAQMAASREWDRPNGARFAYLKAITQPTLVVNGVHDEMVSVRNSYWLSENLPNAVPMTYPDSGHGCCFSTTSPSRHGIPRLQHRRSAVLIVGSDRQTSHQA